MPKTHAKDTGYLFLTTMLRAREAKMPGGDKLTRIVDSSDYADAAKLLSECGYPDMSEMDADTMNAQLEQHKLEILHEIAGHEQARPIADIFRIKYDYHNAKVLVKAAAADVSADALLSECGRIPAETIATAFKAGEYLSLPADIADAMMQAAATLSSTGRPQLSDILIDKAYFAEMKRLAGEIGDSGVIAYVERSIDCANLKTYVRSQRTGQDANFLKLSLIPGGSIEINPGADQEATLQLFGGSGFADAVKLAPSVIGGAEQTQFERACDNSVAYFVSNSVQKSFGAFPVLAYLHALEWEITTIRMVLTGKQAGLEPDIIRERLRDCYV